MSVGPRIVFTRFLTGQSPKLAPWREHFRRVVGHLPGEIVRGTDDADECVVVWQLVSANNRMLARSAVLYGSFDEAVAGARSAVAAADDLSVGLISDDQHGLFGWFVTSAGYPLMTCSRWYGTERDRRQSIELALSSLLVALLSPGARLIHPSLMGGARERINS